MLKEAKKNDSNAQHHVKVAAIIRRDIMEQQIPLIAPP